MAKGKRSAILRLNERVDSVRQMEDVVAVQRESIERVLSRPSPNGPTNYHELMAIALEAWFALYKTCMEGVSGWTSFFDLLSADPATVAKRLSELRNQAAELTDKLNRLLTYQLKLMEQLSPLSGGDEVKTQGTRIDNSPESSYATKKDVYIVESNNMAKPNNSSKAVDTFGADNPHAATYFKFLAEERRQGRLDILSPEATARELEGLRKGNVRFDRKLRAALKSTAPKQA